MLHHRIGVVIALLLLSIAAVPSVPAAAADCTGTNQLAYVDGTRSCDRGGSSPDVCVQDSDGVVSCGAGDGVTAGRITETRVVATQVDNVSDGVTASDDAIQIWGYDLGDAEYHFGGDDAGGLNEWETPEKSDWCCFFPEASELRIVMNDRNNIVWLSCGGYSTPSDGVHYAFVHLPTDVSLLKGDDLYLGGEGRDRVLGGAGDDEIWDCTGGDDELSGEGGADVLWGTFGDDVLDGGDGPDEIYGGVGDDVISGGGGPDLILGRAGKDTIYGGMGNDEIDGGRGRDEIHGGPGADEIRGAKGRDFIYGGPGADDISGGEGQDLLCGGSDDDVLRGKEGADQIIGQAGRDIARGGRGADRCDAEHEASCERDPVKEAPCEISEGPDVITPIPPSSGVEDARSRPAGERDPDAPDARLYRRGAGPKAPPGPRRGDASPRPDAATPGTPRE